MRVTTILHIDMDAFFAAVEVLDHPEWAGKPLVVGSPADKRGVVCTASYEARKFGIHSAMPSRTAYRLCPHAIFAPVRMSRYLDVSEQVMAILGDFTPMIEQLSVDEAFLDVTGVMRSWDSPAALAGAIKARIRKVTGLTASIGIATNKFLAKLASDLHKPDGMTRVPEKREDIQAFLAPLPVNKIWGVGEVTEKLLHQAGFRYMADIQQVGPSVLVPVVGPALADHISRLARGDDQRPVITESAAKSISAENTFDEDVQDRDTVRQELIRLVEQVGRRLRQSDQVAQTVHIKIRFDDFQTITRQEQLPDPVCSDRRLIAAALALFERQSIVQPVRLIGMGVSHFRDAGQTARQLDLFADEAHEREARDARVDRALDHLREKLGPDAIRRAGSWDGKSQLNKG
ncbi:MAG TPA: DNA polymerase IV [Kiritimatiellia bacterium]|nr:DNA polymerase IV [Kiritimatiellia bacterium]HMO51425.1 DNA polymerase IV [Kiritimatiellia bacterium]